VIHAPFSRRTLLAALLAAPVLGVRRITTHANATPAPTPAACSPITRFPVRAGDGPHDVAPAADGQRIWYTAQRSGAAGLLDPESGDVARIPLGPGSAPHGVIVGPDDAAWITDGGLNAIVRVDASSHEVRAYPLPGDDNANLNTAVFARDGALWFTGQAGIVGFLAPVTGEIQIVDAPDGPGPYGITATPGGEIYFASLAGSYLGRINLAPDLPGGFSITVLDPPTSGQGARRVWSDGRGDLWISEWNAGNVARYAARTGEWTEWRLPGESPKPYAIYVDERDHVWLSDFGANTLVRFDPVTESFNSLPLPDAGGNVRQINGRAGELWAPESGADALLRVPIDCVTGTPVP
jgi:virginiamycin B lyase